MPVSYEFHILSISKIKTLKDRQRKQLQKIEELAESIKRNGLLHPIVVTRDGTLVCGGRRLQAFQLLKLKEIPVHYLDELNPYETKAIELEENIKRIDLTWEENCLAAAEYHKLRETADKDWSRKDTAEAIGLSPQYISRLIQVAKELLRDNKNVAAASNMEAAYRVVRRRQERAVKTEAAQIDFNVESKNSEDSKEQPAKIDSEVFVADFVEWAGSYTGRRFNFVHCDFPYGVKYGTTKYSGSQTWDKYDDSFDAYTRLLSALIEHKDRLFFPSAHLMFWFSMNYYSFTMDVLTNAGFSVNPFPLIWSKDRGLIPDPQRGPRRVYETAFHASLGDRKIVRSVLNLEYAVVKKLEHISTKPQSMLEHFFRMFADDLTEILDPTCGSGTALAAAKASGVKRIVGLDINKDYVEAAELLIKGAKGPKS